MAYIERDDEFGFGEEPYEPYQPPQMAQPQAAPASPFNRQAFLEAWQGSAGHTPEDLRRVASQFQGINIGGKGGDIVTLPGYTEEGTGIYRGPEQLDVIGDVGGANTWAWSGIGPGAAGGGGGGIGGGGGETSGAGGVGGGGANVDPQMREYLLRLMARSEPGAIDVSTDPNLAPQARAYETARQRGAQRERARLAERAAFTGLNTGGQGSGAFTGGLGDIYQRAGEDIAGQQAGLVGQEVAARRNDLLNALQLANAVGARDQSTAIQKQLAELDNSYRYAALGQNQRQFEDQYGLNLAQLQEQANRNALLTALGGGV